MKATRKTVERKDVLGPVLASISINKDAERMVNEETGEEYLSCWKSVPGGFVELFVYGNGATPGKSVPAMVKVRAKLVNKQWVPYARADIADGTPAHKLFIGSPEAIGKLDLTLPSMTSNETFVKDGQDKVRCSLIGFVKIAA